MRIKLLTAAAIIASLAILAACGGSETKSPAGETKETASSGAASAKGEEVYKKTCVACHQANGEGIANTFPPLAKSDFLADKNAVIHQVLKGKTGEITVNGVTYNSMMPPQNLNDDEIAAVLNYVYGQWGNNGSNVSTDEVKSARETASP